MSLTFRTGGKRLKTIKNLIYLDEYKMYSLASQMFRGVTESVVRIDASTNEQRDGQDGSFFSGRTMADILTSGTSTQERKYLHDYAYTRFEDELYDSDKIVSITSDNADSAIHQISGTKFIAVRGKIAFHDIDAVRNVLAKFNDVGEAVSYVTMFPDPAAASTDIQRKSGGPRKGGQQSKRSDANQKLAMAKEAAKSQGMALDPTFVKKLGEILDHGYEGLFYVTIDVGAYLFSATVQRQFFREPDALILRKYARLSEHDFALVGSVVDGLQGSRSNSKSNPSISLPDPIREIQEDGDFEFSGLRDGIETFTGILHALDGIFTGKRANEVIMDPIALYREI